MMLQWLTMKVESMGKNVVSQRENNAQMGALPVGEVLSDILSALRTSPQVLLHAPTGAGKSTWLPLQILKYSGLPGRIIMLEPRRLAAKNVAYRLLSNWGNSRARLWAIGCEPKAKAGRIPALRW